MHMCLPVYGVCGTLPEIDFQGHSHCFPSFLRHFTELGAISAGLPSQQTLGAHLSLPNLVSLEEQSVFFSMLCFSECVSIYPVFPGVSRQGVLVHFLDSCIAS